MFAPALIHCRDTPADEEVMLNALRSGQVAALVVENRYAFYKEGRDVSDAMHAFAWNRS